MRVDDAALRVQLEGRVELLEAARLRYRALLQMLNAFRWRDRLRKNGPLLREVVRAHASVKEAVDFVTRRAKKEAWTQSTVLTCAKDVAWLEEALLKVSARRLGDEGRLSLLMDRSKKTAGLAGHLVALEDRVVTAPRLVVPGQRWSTAIEVLPGNLPALERAGRFGALLASLFSRPLQPAERLPFTLEELEALFDAWPQGEAALAEVWRRVEQVDLAGTLTRYLRRRARRTPLGQPKNGAETLLFAEFWRTFSAARLTAVLESRVGPVSCKEPERFPVVRWLWHRERDAEARLQASAILSDGRAGLFELAHELTAFPGTRARGLPAWEGLLARAARADAARDDPDWKALRDALRLLLRVLSGSDRRLLPPLYRAAHPRPEKPATRDEDPDSLEGLIERMREQVGSAA